MSVTGSASSRLLSQGLPGFLLLMAGCSSAPVVLSHGSVRVDFKGDATCGFENPYVVDAKGCRVIDKGALMCKGFGVIDGVLFAGGCEAAAEAEILETNGTSPLAPVPVGSVPDEARDPSEKDERARP
jgi:hypothetical protein